MSSNLSSDVFRVCIVQFKNIVCEGSNTFIYGIVSDELAMRIVDQIALSNSER